MLWTVADAPSVSTCYFEVYEKFIYPDRHIVLSFRQRKIVGHQCSPFLIVTIWWVVVIYHTIFLMRSVLFCYIWIEVKYWWFDMGYSPPDYSYTKAFIEFFVVIPVKDRVNGWLYELQKNQFVFNTKIIHSLNMSFSHHICCCFILCNNFNCFI